MFRVRGQGAAEPALGAPGRPASCSCKIEIPKKLTAKQEKLLRDYATAEETIVLPETQGFWKKVKDFMSGE
jgi:molecular chaperone DnaJ